MKILMYIILGIAIFTTAIYAIDYQKHKEHDAKYGVTKPVSQ